MLTWLDEYSVGIDIIDEQHKHLFEIGNQAYELLKDEFRIDKYDQIVEIIDELRDYTVFHFKTEEELMQKIKYKRFLSQKIAHDEFIKKIMEVDLNKIDSNQEEYLQKLLSFIFDWITTHIIKNDKLIAEGLK